MRQAQAILYETDGRLTKLLSPLFTEQSWRLREMRQLSSVREILGERVPVLILKLGRDLHEELALLEQVSWTYPDTGTVVVGDVAHPELEGLAWDLGANFVHFPPLSRDHLPGIVYGLMTGDRRKNIRLPNGKEE